MGQRLKFYGWGNEGDGSTPLRARQCLFRFVADKLGVEPRLSAPPQASDIALRAPRVSAPRRARRRAHPRPLRAALAYLWQVLPRYCARVRSRLRQRARSRRPAQYRIRIPRPCSIGRAARRSRSFRSAAAPRSSAGSSRRSATATPARSASTCAISTGCSRSTRQARRTHSGRHSRAVDRGGLETAWPRHPPLSAELRVL